jgi:hypothetical protein
MWFMNEKLKMCLASKGLGSTHIYSWLEVFRPITGFSHALPKVISKGLSTSKSKHPQAVHNIL